MPTGRLSALVALTVALALGLAPWRVCAHADDDHARVYVLGLGHAHAHANEHEHDDEAGHDHHHATRSARAAPGAHRHGRHVHRACGPGCTSHASGAARGVAAHVHGHAHACDGTSRSAPGRHAHAPASGRPAPGNDLRVPGHDHDHAHPDGHCHCGDHPLVPGLTLTPVALDAHAAACATTTWVAALVSDVGTPEVVPTARPRGCRIACEEDPIVLLR